MSRYIRACTRAAEERERPTTTTRRITRPKWEGGGRCACAWLIDFEYLLRVRLGAIRTSVLRAENEKTRGKYVARERYPDKNSGGPFRNYEFGAPAINNRIAIIIASIPSRERVYRPRSFVRKTRFFGYSRATINRPELCRRHTHTHIYTHRPFKIIRNNNNIR